MPNTIDREFFAGAMAVLDALMVESRDQEIGVELIPFYDAIQRTMLKFAIREEGDSDIIREIVRSVFEMVEVQHDENNESEGAETTT